MCLLRREEVHVASAAFRNAPIVRVYHRPAFVFVFLAQVPDKRILDGPSDRLSRLVQSCRISPFVAHMSRMCRPWWIVHFVNHLWLPCHLVLAQSVPIATVASKTKFPTSSPRPSQLFRDHNFVFFYSADCVCCACHDANM